MRLRIASAALLLLAYAGPARSAERADDLGLDPSLAKIGLSVVLELEGFLDAPNSTATPLARTFLSRLGARLEAAVGEVANASFSDVAREGPIDPGRPRLRPRLAAFDAGGGGSNLFTIVLEWSLLQPDETLVWVETVAHTSTLDRVAIRRVMQASQLELTRSRELRTFAQHPDWLMAAPAP